MVLSFRTCGIPHPDMMIRVILICLLWRLMGGKSQKCATQASDAILGSKSTQSS